MIEVMSLITLISIWTALEAFGLNLFIIRYCWRIDS